MKLTFIFYLLYSNLSKKVLDGDVSRHGILPIPMPSKRYNPTSVRNLKTDSKKKGKGERRGSLPLGKHTATYGVMGLHAWSEVEAGFGW